MPVRFTNDEASASTPATSMVRTPSENVDFTTDFSEGSIIRRPGRKNTHDADMNSLVEAGVASAWLDTLQRAQLTRGGTESLSNYDAGGRLAGGDMSQAISSTTTTGSQMVYDTRTDVIQGRRPTDNEAHGIVPMDLGSALGSDGDAEVIREMIFERMHGDPLLCIPAQERNGEDGELHYFQETQIEAMMKFYGLSETKAEIRKKLRNMRLKDLMMKYQIKGGKKKKRQKDRQGKFESDDEDDRNSWWFSEVDESAAPGTQSLAQSRATADKRPEVEATKSEDANLQLPELYVPDPRAVAEYLWCLWRHAALDVNTALGFKLFQTAVYVANAIWLCVKEVSFDGRLMKLMMVDRVFALVLAVIYMVRVEGRTGSDGFLTHRALIVDFLLVWPPVFDVLIGSFRGSDAELHIYPITVFLVWHLFETRRFRSWHWLNALRIIVRCVKSGSSAGFWGLLMLTILTYAFSLLIRFLLRGEDTSNMREFSTLGNTMVACMNMVLGRFWAIDQVRPLRQDPNYTVIAVVVYLYLCFCRMLLFGFIIGSFIDLALHAGVGDRWHVSQEKLLTSIRLGQLKRSLEDIDVNGNGLLSWPELWYGLTAKPVLKKILDMTIEEAQAMFKELDSDCLGEIPLELIVYFHIKRKGASASVDAMVMDRQLRLLQQAMVMPPGTISGVANKVRLLERRMIKQGSMLRNMRYIIQLQFKRLDSRLHRLEDKVTDIMRTFMKPQDLQEAGFNVHEGGMVVAAMRLRGELQELQEATRIFLAHQIDRQEQRHLATRRQEIVQESGRADHSHLAGTEDDDESPSDTEMEIV